MRKLILAFFLSLISLPVVAEALPCDNLKARVDAKLQAKGVQTYTLEIVSTQGSAPAANAASGVAATKARKGKEVGTCDNGTKRLIYTKGD